MGVLKVQLLDRSVCSSLYFYRELYAVRVLVLKGERIPLDIVIVNENFNHGRSCLSLSLFMKGVLPSQRVDKAYRCTQLLVTKLVSHNQVINFVLFCDCGCLAHTAGCNHGNRECW